MFEVPVTSFLIISLVMLRDYEQKSETRLVRRLNKLMDTLTGWTLLQEDALKKM
jgi:hypothetical protein